MKLNPSVLARYALGFAALLAATSGCAQRKVNEQQAGQAAMQQQQQAQFYQKQQAYERGFNACKTQEAGTASSAPTVTAALTDPTGQKGCNCSCQTAKQGGVSGSAEVKPEGKSESSKGSSYQ
jgi:hypothetical protein